MSDRQVVTLSIGERELNLTQALKRAGCVLSGGEAKALIADSLVSVNGQIELRKRRQLAVGDVIQIEGGPEIRLT